ncbi:MAG: hypothetical protein SCH71_16905 [Desulfobulbaceae bacterium]|nr:hypothetical protein [Desulfobulbaceae bacterium]
MNKVKFLPTAGYFLNSRIKKIVIETLYSIIFHGKKKLLIQHGKAGSEKAADKSRTGVQPDPGG